MEDLNSNGLDRPNISSILGSSEMSFEDTEHEPRSKSSLRLKYEAEKKVLEKQLGSLEDIRSRLGLSQRKMAQLLMVDPSAWTRWIKNPEKVPPHVYRALQWYLELTEKKPQWSPHNSFGPLTQKIETSRYADSSNSENSQILSSELASLKAQSDRWAREVMLLQEALSEQASSFSDKVEQKDTALTMWKLFVLMNSIAIFFWIVWSLI